MKRQTPRQSRRERKKLRASRGLEVAVVTAAGNDRASGNGLSLRRDIELVRAAVLYADEIELISLNATTLESLTRLGSSDSRHLFEFLSSLDDETFRDLGGYAFPEGWREKLPRAMTTARGRATLDQIVAPLAERLRQRGTELFNDSGAAELTTARDLGIVRLTPAADSRALANALTSYHTGSSRRLTDPGDVLRDWLGLVGRLLEDPKKRLLFDDEAGDIAAKLVDMRMVTPSPVVMRHAGEAAVGSGLIARLPALPQAPLDELLDLRADLAGPLTRYRRAVASLAATLTARSFDQDGIAEIDDLWTVTVAPALTDIAEGLEQHGLVREVGKALSKDVKFLLTEGAAIYVGLHNLTTLNSWISATAASVATGVTGLASGALNSHSARRELQGHDLFYLYEVSRRIR